ncbi:MAG: 6-phosphogluconolactonase [Candidatus Dormiibacterota bacterium]
MTASGMKARIFDDAQSVAQATADLVAAALAGGVERLVLAGGTTPKLAYRLLSPGPVWGKVTIFFGDERCVPPDDPESNYAMAREELLSRVDPASVHRIPGELGAEEAAARYDAVLRGAGPLDLVLLGMGQDGHTASLFPGAPELGLTGAKAIAVHNAPKPPPDRISLSLEALREARRVVFIVTGSDKADAVVKASRGEVPSGMVPGAEYLLDRAAAAALPEGATA